MGLFGRPVEHHQWFGRLGRCAALGRPSAALAGETFLDGACDVVMVAVPGHRDHHVPGPVVVLEEPPHVGDGDVAHALGRPEGVTAQGMIREQRPEAPLDDQVARLVGVHQDLVEDHRPLRVEVGRAEGRGPHDLAQDVEAER